MSADRVHRFLLIFWLAALALAGVPALFAGDDYIGAESCAACHQAEFDAWQGSHHDLAMQHATAETVLGDFDDAEITMHGVTSRFFKKDGKFFVFTEGPDGEMMEFEIAYTFGIEPLQQFLVGHGIGSRARVVGLRRGF